MFAFVLTCMHACMCTHQRVTVLCWYRLAAQLFDFKSRDQGKNDMNFDIAAVTGMLYYDYDDDDYCCFMLLLLQLVLNCCCYKNQIEIEMESNCSSLIVV